MEGGGHFPAGNKAVIDNAQSLTANFSNVYVRSRRAGERVMASIMRFITTKLKVRVNEQKSAVARPWERKFLGFSFTADRAESGDPVQSESPGSDATDAGRERGEDGRGVGPSPSRLEWLFRSLPDAFGAARS